MNDITGDRFGRLTALEVVGTAPNHGGNRHNRHATQRPPKHRNTLQWEAARAKYEYRLRQGASLALDYAQMCCGRDSDTAIRDIESVIQFHLKEWEERNPNPKEK